MEGFVYHFSLVTALSIVLGICTWYVLKEIAILLGVVVLIFALFGLYGFKHHYLDQTSENVSVIQSTPPISGENTFRPRPAQRLSEIRRNNEDLKSSSDWKAT